jgi:hypothetical protein
MTMMNTVKIIFLSLFLLSNLAFADWKEQEFFLSKNIKTYKESEGSDVVATFVVQKVKKGFSFPDKVAATKFASGEKSQARRGLAGITEYKVEKTEITKLADKSILRTQGSYKNIKDKQVLFIQKSILKSQQIYSLHLKSITLSLDELNLKMESLEKHLNL